MLGNKRQEQETGYNDDDYDDHDEDVDDHYGVFR